MKYLFLSHFLDEETPGYGGNNDFKRNPLKCIDHGDSCNQQSWSFTNHIGTHIDSPKHFAKDGKMICDYPAEFWISKRVHLLDIPRKDETMITKEDLIDKIPADTEMLIIRTGFEKLRQDKMYWNNNPGMSSCSGKYLRENFNLKFIGFDFISLTSYQNRPEGRVAHDAYLNPEHDGEPILIIEDMKLDELTPSIEEVIVSPLQISKADGAQVNVMAKVRS